MLAACSITKAEELVALAVKVKKQLIAVPCPLRLQHAG